MWANDKDDLLDHVFNILLTDKQNKPVGDEVTASTPIVCLRGAIWQQFE